MKKVLCVMLSLLVLAGCTATAEGSAILNPNGYDLLMVTDIFTNDDSEAGESGEEGARAESLTLQGVFGAISYPTIDDSVSEGESEGMTMVGFDPEDTVSLTLAANGELWMPKDMLNPVENEKIDDLQAWYDAAQAQMADYLAEGQSSYSFYAQFEMNDDGELTKLEYCYFDWN